MPFDMLHFAEDMHCHEIHMVIDEPTGLEGVIAIYDTTLGPALGGCRFIEYSSTEDAVKDAIRLAQGMTYKASIAGLDLGGGKAVLLKPKKIIDRKAYFQAFGRFVHQLNGRYITAEDSGTDTQDMDDIASVTPYVCCTSVQKKFSVADPSPLTARGVKKGIESTVRFKGGSSLVGLHIAIQGLGHVGYNLASFLNAAGARLTVFDVDTARVKRCVDEFGAKSVTSLDALLKTPADVFAPCALGGVFDERTIDLLKAPIIAGAANNQLVEPKHGDYLQQKGVLYAPDFVVNGGGLLYVAAQYTQSSEEETIARIDGIYNTLEEIFKRSKESQIATHSIACLMAEERIKKTPKNRP